MAHRVQLPPLIETPADPGAHEALEDRLASVQRVVGEAVHPRAVERLVQAWPDAVVRVSHGPGRHDGVESKVTRVRLCNREPLDGEAPGDGLLESIGEARCRLDFDQWDRRRGIALAFNRALKMVG